MPGDGIGAPGLIRVLAWRSVFVARRPCRACGLEEFSWMETDSTDSLARSQQEQVGAA
jgi:hypothetical protein